MIPTGVEARTPDMAGGAEVVLVIFVGVVEAVLAGLGKEDDAIAIDLRLDDREIIRAMAGMTLVTRFLEGALDGVVIILIAVSAGFRQRKQVGIIAEGIAGTTAWDHRLGTAIIIMAILTEVR